MIDNIFNFTMKHIGSILIIAFILYSWKVGFDTSEWFYNSGGM